MKNIKIYSNNLKKDKVYKLKKTALRLSIFGLLGLSALNLVDGLSNNGVKEKDGKVSVYLKQDKNIDEDDYLFLEFDGDAKKLKKELKKISSKLLSIGIIVNVDTNDMSTDELVDSIKSILKEYNISLPIYLDINDIVEDEQLENEEKKKFVKSFLKKCSKNNMYVGVYGYDSNLVELNKIYNLENYDAFLVQDGEKIKYKGVYYIYVDNDKKTHIKESLNEIIKEKKLNKIKDDENKEVKDNKEEDKKKKEEKEKKEKIDDKDKNYNYLKGVDFKNTSGKIKWDKLESEMDFVILKVNEGDLLDKGFEKYAKKCEERGIPIGVYCFASHRRSGYYYKDLEEFKKVQMEQALITLEAIKDNKIDYPVYFDLENDPKKGRSVQDEYDAEHIKVALDVWYEVFSSHGYTPGLYVGKHNYCYIKSCGYDLDKFNVWISGSQENDSSYKKSIDFKDADELRPNGNKIEYKYHNEIYSFDADIIQVCDHVKNGPVNNSLGDMDLDYMISEVEEEDHNYFNYALLAIDTILIGVVIAKKRKKRKNGEKVYHI